MVAMATNFGTKIAITGFVWIIATIGNWLWRGLWAVGQQNADIAETLQLRDVAMATIFVFLYVGCTLALPGEYYWTVHVRRRCGLISKYFDHLFYSLHRLQTVSSQWALKEIITQLEDLQERKGNWTMSRKLAKMAVALQVLQVMLHTVLAVHW